MSPTVPSAAFLSALHRLLAAGQQEAGRRGYPLLVSATVDSVPLEPAALFRRLQDQERILWEQPSQSFALVAAGTAVRLTGQGAPRFTQVAAGWHSLLSRALVEAVPTCPLPAPVSLGGFAFASSRQADPCWEGYPDALLVIPRFLFISRAGSAWLSVNALVTPGCDIGVTVATIDQALHDLWRGDGTTTCVATNGSVVSLDDVQAPQWKKAVVALVREIERGTVEKLVLARQVRVCFPRSVDPCAVLERLRGGYRHCTVFAFASGQRCFVGATPERLVRLQGQTVHADCLAGSASRGTTEAADRALGEALLTDGKERHEHALVVRALRDALAPLCSQVSVAEVPTLLRLPQVQHLYTPLRGTLKGKGDIFELVERLHPTPATGGIPRHLVSSLLRTYEPFDRGWYAGPLGWIDGQGNGEFVVAIRSALLKGDEALLYAGCGIVAGSDPEREYEESCLKLKSMLWALGGMQQ